MAMLLCCDTISCRSPVRAGSIKMSGVALGRRRDIKINFRIHDVSQTNYFLLRVQILSQGEKKETQDVIFGGSFQVFGNMLCRLKKERDSSETLRATRYKVGKTSFNLESWDTENMCFITPSSGGLHQGGSCCHSLLCRSSSCVCVCVWTRCNVTTRHPKATSIGAGCQAAGVKFFTGLVSHSHISKTKNKRREQKWRAAKWDAQRKKTQKRIATHELYFSSHGHTSKGE